MCGMRTRALRCLKPFQLNGDDIRGFGFTPDSQRLLICAQSSDESARSHCGDDRFGDGANAVLEKGHQSRADVFLAGRSMAGGGEAGSRHRGAGRSRRESLLAALKGHTKEIIELTFQSNVLISASTDGTVRLWRLPTGEPIRDPLSEQSATVQLPPFLSHDGQLARHQRRDQAG